MHRLKSILKSTAVIALALMPSFVVPSLALAATSNPTPGAKVSFTFDEGYDSTYTQAAPTLAKYGFSGTAYITTGCVGMTTIPNTCHANNDAKYITWDQISKLKNTYGWEIGSHTVSHPYLASFDAEDGQPNKLTPEQVRYELAQSKADLAARGYNATSFATPYGDYDMPVLAEIAKHYSSHRGFADTGYNIWPNSDYIVKVQQVQAGVSVAKVKSYIDAAIKNKQWLVLVFHDIKTRPSNSPDDYQYSTGNLNKIAAYVKQKNLPVVNPSQSLVSSDVNLLPNGSFSNGISNGWTTDTAASVVADSNNNGSYPESTNSIKFTAGSTNSHLFSPRITVSSNTTYMLKNFINVQKINSGELGFYIDEYDASGNWISGQWKNAERSVFVESFNFSYKPTSAAVSHASLQVYASGNSGIVAYLDNIQWFPLSNVTEPVPTNLVANSSFDNGVGGGWSTDNAVQVVHDLAGNGSPSNATSSIKFVSTSSNIHLFSPMVTVNPAKTYSITSYLNIVQLGSGEVGFYIDEYDASGNWISGQWKTARDSGGAGDIAFVYRPSSASVAKASLQVYTTANSNIQAYYDDVRWFEL